VIGRFRAMIDGGCSDARPRFDLSRPRCRHGPSRICPDDTMEARNSAASPTIPKQSATVPFRERTVLGWAGSARHRDTGCTGG